jgi:hypothetical protein
VKKWAVYSLCAIAFACGAVAAYFVSIYLQAGFNGKAYLSKSFSSKGEETPIYGESALAQKDLIPFPKIDNLNFKAKFVGTTGAGENSVSLSYIAEITVEKLDKKDLPERFSKKFVEDNAEWMYVPPDDVLYEISFKLALLDKDGFPILSTESPTETIRSGELNRVQNIVTDKIPADLAQRVRAVKPAVVMKKFLRPLYREKTPL